jgi:hypothetical protein
MLVQFALLRSGYSDEKLEPNDPLAKAAQRFSASPEPKKTSKLKKAKCEPGADRTALKVRRDKARPITAKSNKKVGARQTFCPGVHFPL